ncbi:MAG: patatin-like phospholipase family protein [Rubrivivax sp.]|nr:patatin-like phospholipase family protein [Rubrivivax sp.]
MTARRIRRIDLALQGGGAHGAFTWGVLDRLLEDERIEFDAISGASAGAMNAVVLADGLARGGRRAAREALRNFWSRVSNATGRGPSAAPNALALMFGQGWLAASPWSAMLEQFGRSLAPTQFNPLNLNPLRDILAAEVDFERLRAYRGVRVVVGATQVRTGRLREFGHGELSVDVVMASACLPLLFHAVEIDGEAYWDGGYLANPSLLPLVAHSATHDLVLVQINPSRREAVPRLVPEIADRLDEITFNGSLVKELRALALIRRLLREDGADPERRRAPLFRQIAALRLHRIEAGEDLARPGATNRQDAGWRQLSRLHRLGREAASAWIEQSFAHLGRRSTLPLEPYLVGIAL